MNADDLLEVFEVMLRARLFEEEVGRAVVSGEIHGEMHLGIGHEAVGAALGRHLRPGELAAELLERDGLNHGKGGHMHLFDSAARFMCTGIVGAGVPIAAGYALMQSLLTLRDIESLTKLSRSTIERLERAGRFPAPDPRPA